MSLKKVDTDNDADNDCGLEAGSIAYMKEAFTAPDCRFGVKVDAPIICGALGQIHNKELFSAEKDVPPLLAHAGLVEIDEVAKILGVEQLQKLMQELAKRWAAMGHTGMKLINHKTGETVELGGEQ